MPTDDHMFLGLDLLVKGRNTYIQQAFVYVPGAMTTLNFLSLVSHLTDFLPHSESVSNTCFPKAKPVAKRAYTDPDTTSTCSSQTIRARGIRF